MCKKDEVIATHDDGDIVFTSKVRDDVYYLETIPDERHVANVSVNNDQKEPGNSDEGIEVIEAKAYKTTVSWHERLGHLHGNAISKILVLGMKEDSKKCNELYGVCVREKMTKVPFLRTIHHMCQCPLEIIHSDINGRAQCKLLGGRNYFVTFIDDFSCFMHVRIISRKSKVFECFKEYQMEVEALHQFKISIVQTDNGGEYTGINFENYLKKKGIMHRKNISRNPEHNGISE